MQIQYSICLELICIAERWIHKEQDKLSLKLSYTWEKHRNTIKAPFLHSNTYPTRCNVTQFIYIWKLLYTFRVVPPPIIRSAYNCIYSIWYLSHHYCSLPLAAGSSNGMTNTRCCRYSCIWSWWWVEVPPKTCRAVPRHK